MCNHCNKAPNDFAAMLAWIIVMLVLLGIFLLAIRPEIPANGDGFIGGNLMQYEQFLAMNY